MNPWPSDTRVLQVLPQSCRVCQAKPEVIILVALTFIKCDRTQSDPSVSLWWIWKRLSGTILGLLNARPAKFTIL